MSHEAFLPTTRGEFSHNIPTSPFLKEETWVRAPGWAGQREGADWLILVSNEDWEESGTSSAPSVPDSEETVHILVAGNVTGEKVLCSSGGL